MTVKEFRKVNSYGAGGLRYENFCIFLWYIVPVLVLLWPRVRFMLLFIFAFLFLSLEIVGVGVVALESFLLAFVHEP